MPKYRRPRTPYTHRIALPALFTLITTVFITAVAPLPQADVSSEAYGGKAAATQEVTAEPVPLSYTFGAEANGTYEVDENARLANGGTDDVYASYDEGADDATGEGLLAPGDEGFDFRTQGVVLAHGIRYTWYSENDLPGYGLDSLNANGRHVGDDGLIRDGEGYIAVASDDYPLGMALSTPFGLAKVYDTGCPSGTIDVYTNF